MIGDQSTDMQFAKKSGIKGFLFRKIYIILLSQKIYKKINFNKNFLHNDQLFRNAHQLFCIKISMNFI